VILSLLPQFVPHCSSGAKNFSRVLIPLALILPPFLKSFILVESPREFRKPFGILHLEPPQFRVLKEIFVRFHEETVLAAILGSKRGFDLRQSGEGGSGQ